MGLRIRRIATADEFAGLARPWAELARASGQTSPFLSHDWFSCCWHAQAPGRQPEIVVLEEDRHPAAVLPLVRWKTRRYGLPVRVLGFLDSPDTPMADVLTAIEPGGAVGAFLDHLAARSDWDLACLEKLPATSATVKTLEDLLPGRMAWRRGEPTRSPYLAISGSWEAFFRGKTQRFRKTCRNLDNRLQRAGTVSVEEHRAVACDGPVFTELMDVSRQSWKGPRGLAMATMHGMPRFFEDLTRRASANGWLHVWILRLDGRAVATEYQIGADGVRHALRADFVPDLAALSPGACLNLHIIQSLFERHGVREYDMGPGSNEYKLRWATGTREAPSLEVYAPSVYGRLLHQMETRLAPVARRWRDRFRTNSVRRFESSNVRVESSCRGRSADGTAP